MSKQKETHLSHQKETHVIRTVRIPASMDKALRKIAFDGNTSVNALVEASLTKFIEFDQYAEELEYATVRKAFLIKGLEYFDEGEIRDFGKWAAMESTSELLQFFGVGSNLDSIFHIFETVISKYGRLFTFHHESDGKTHRILLNHRLGKNWSIFFDANLKTLFARLGIDLQTEVSTNFVRAHFVEKP
ncbi:MAG: hypothetical protein OK438_00970 [Thaumarchaeota archaeon]|nr:hypothetical protein [Nitrososphaerota archaeon]